MTVEVPDFSQPGPARAAMMLARIADRSFDRIYEAQDQLDALDLVKPLGVYAPKEVRTQLKREIDSANNMFVETQAIADMILPGPRES